MADHKNKTRTTFMSLPVEIRTEIYGILLEENRGIAVAIYRQKSTAPTAKTSTVRQVFAPKIIRDNDLHNYKKKRRGTVYNPSTRAWEPRTPIKTAILYANRQISAEAIQVLFGINRFIFRNTTCLNQFLDVAGPRASHLRSIEVTQGGWIMKDTAQALQKLGSTAKFLKHIRLDHHELCKATERKRHIMTSSCADLLKALQVSHDEANLTFDSLSVIDIKMQQTCLSTLLFRQLLVPGMECEDIRRFRAAVNEKAVGIIQEARSLQARSLQAQSHTL